MKQALAWAVTVVVLLGIAAWGLVRWQQPPQGLQTMPPWPVVVPAKVADIVLRAAGPGMQPGHLARRGKAWQGQDGKAWQDADGQAVADMLGTLAAMRPDRIVTRKPAHYAALRVGDGVEPGAPHQVGRKTVRRRLLEKTGARSDFERWATRLAVGQQSREEFLVVHAPQYGLPLPNSAVTKKLFVGLCVDGHCAFSDCTEFREAGHAKL